MKKVFCGILIGIILTSTFATAVTYVAEDVNFKIFVNGKEFTSAPAVAINGSTYLPLRAIGDSLGVPVKWNTELHQVEIGKSESQIETITKINDTWKITYTGQKVCDEVGSLPQKAREGREFIIVKFEIENITDELQTFSMFGMDYYVDDYKTSPSLIAEQIDGYNFIGASHPIEAGKKFKGYFSFEPKKGWNKLEIMFEGKSDSNSKLVFDITR